MAPKQVKNDSSSALLLEESSISKTGKDSKKHSGKDPPPKDPSAPSPKSGDDSDSPQSAPSKPPPSPSPPLPPLKSPPPSRNFFPILPPPSIPPPSSPPPPLPSPPPPPLPSPSPPPPRSSPPPPPPWRSSNSSSPPIPHPPPPKFQPPPPPPPPERPSSSPPPSRSAPSNDSTPGTSNNNSPTKSPLSPVPSPGFRSGPNHKAMHGGGDGGGGGDSHAKPRGSSHRSSPADNSGKYVGYTLAAVFVVALVAVALFFTYRRKKTKGESYDAPYMLAPNNTFHAKSGTNGLIYAQQPQSPHGNNIGGGSMRNIGGGPLDSAQPKSAQIAFSYDMVIEITNAFSSENVIGEGGFGCVYKGWLPDGRVVAVKQLKVGSGQGDREFRAEVEIISRVHHRHLVSLVGYCISEQQRVLIYEFVPNGTLYHHLHGSEMLVLDWAKRLRIAIGAAKGLAYLHEDCSQKIIHRDIKSANILLDDVFEAQVADFGLARLADTANTHVSTRVMGTFGYMAPEYATSGKLTDRSDVFSFGVVLLELVTGRKPVDQTQPLGDESLVEWARPLLLHAIETRDFSELIDPRLEMHFVESEMFRMIEAAAACVRHSAPKRPRMVQVVRALDSGDEVSDLTNGVKYGHSTVYDSGQYDKDIMLFRRMAKGSFVDSDFDMYSRQFSYSREMSGSRHAWMQSSSSGESESKAFNKHGNSTE